MGSCVPAGALYNHSEKGSKTVIMSYTACLYLGSILVNIYLLPYLYLVSSNFATVPYLILGIVAALSNSRPALVVYAALLGIVFVLELASIFTSMELRNGMQLPRFFQMRNKAVYDEMSLYWVDEDIKFKWDTLQRDFQCCGAFEKSGYNDWNQRISSNHLSTSNRLSSNQNQIPDSCCIDEHEGCAKSVVITDQTLFDQIYMHGCISIMRIRLTHDILPVLLAYIISGVVLALITIVTLVVAAAYVAAITRNEKQDRDGWGCTRCQGDTIQVPIDMRTPLSVNLTLTLLTVG